MGQWGPDMSGEFQADRHTVTAECSEELRALKGTKGGVGAIGQWGGRLPWWPTWVLPLTPQGPQTRQDLCTESRTRPEHSPKLQTKHTHPQMMTKILEGTGRRRLRRGPRRNRGSPAMPDTRRSQIWQERSRETQQGHSPETLVQGSGFWTAGGLMVRESPPSAPPRLRRRGAGLRLCGRRGAARCRTGR